jgi:4-amino-4-deoxy-L-arabinose transferase-like glycosyltransferase
MGPLFHYMLATGFNFGGEMGWPRVFVMVMGSLTVGLTYLLGAGVAALAISESAPRRSLTIRLSGVLAALLMGVSFVPVVVNSHVDWSNSITPFWTTLTLLLCVLAVRRGKPWMLIAAGVAGGLALQTHPSAIAILLGAGLWVVVVRPTWLRTPAPWIAVAALALTVGNLIYFNVTTGGASVDRASQRHYAYTGGASAMEYATNIAGFVRQSYQTVGSTFLATDAEVADPAAVARALRQPGAILYGLLALTALVGLASRGRSSALPALCWLAALVVLPYFNKGWQNYVLGRYLAPLLPPTFAAIGVMLAAGMVGRPVRLRALASSAACVILLAYPLARLDRFYDGEERAGRTNARVWQLAEELRQRGTERNPVLLDENLKDIEFPEGSDARRSLDLLMRMAGTPHRISEEHELAGAPEDAYLVMASSTRRELEDEIYMEPVMPNVLRQPSAPGEYWAYRVLDDPDPSFSSAISAIDDSTQAD